ncbi:hypothetical protein DSC47_11305 [Elizabethkingia miricola]|uniref:hypothetical protein n=1 Tax=Elizabethkingia bruuniana TaxID=1756149 RepID=UPI00099A2645|nr:hypothetical protein [Elizabethkingia bruuniana]OPC58141.1 hypothetical protein BAY07_03350 [Elizabethkingia bruuniana]OPC62452.1 hypothetical protein BAY13_06430 [Elizabethkingia bruuniana]RBI91859.1 hypothetical protein DSC47_11305 [Elizabethkingia miricola]
MDHFLIESIFRLQTRNKLIVTGSIKSDLKLENYIINVIVLNNSVIPINTVNETIIENQPYLALTINIDCISEDLLSTIMNLKKGQIIQIK